MKKSFFATTLLCPLTFSLFAQSTNLDTENSLDNAPPAVQASITKAINQATQTENEVWLTNPNFKSHFTKNTISLSPRGNDLNWQWQLQSINGQAATEAIPQLREAYQKELVDYDRGNITERYVFHRGSIEQRFIVHEMPAAGHLHIAGNILTEGIFKKEDDHWLWANGKSSVKLGQLYVYDAKGATIAADFEVGVDYTTIIIEEEALAAATFPVTIDPEIGPSDFRISVSGPEGDGDFDAITPAVAYNSVDNNYLVVWSGEDNSGTLVENEQEIFGQIINADGTLLISNFRLSDVGPNGNKDFDAVTPDVAYNPNTNNYLVVWSGDESSFSSVNNEFEIYGQLVSNLGAEIGPNDFRISDMGPDRNELFTARNPAVAYNQTANNFLVVWDGDDDVNNEREIHGQLVAPDATEIGSDFQISEQGPNGNTNFDAIKPSLAYNSEENNYLVVWEGDDNTGGLVNDEFEIYGQRVRADGTELGSNFKISDMGPDGNANFDAIEASIAYNSKENEYLVVWQGDDNNESANNAFEIYGQRLSAGGLAVGNNDFRISTAGLTNSTGFSAERPAIAYDDLRNRYLVVWEAIDRVENVNEDEAWGQFIDAAGFQMAPDDFRISQLGTVGNTNFDTDHVRVAFNSTAGNFLSVWAGEDVGLGQAFEIYGQLLDLQAPTEQFRITNQGPANDADFDAELPAVAFNTQDSSYLVVWRGTGAVSTEAEIFGQLVSKEGFPLDFAFQISQATAVNASADVQRPAVAYNSTDNNFLVVWQADATGVNNEFEIYGQFITADGRETGPDDFQVSEQGPAGDLFFDASDAALAYNATANNFLVVWSGDDNVNSSDEAFEIYGQLINTLGDRTLTDDIRISDMGTTNDDNFFDAFTPDVAYNPTTNNFLVVWEGDDDTGILVNDEFEIYGQFIAADGTETGTNDFRISQQGPDGNPNFAAQGVALAFNSVDNNYLVVWFGDFNDGTFLPEEDEIFGQLIAANGSPQGTDFRISDMGVDGNVDFDAFNPDVAHNPTDNNYLVSWEGDDIVDDALEIHVQLLTADGNEFGENDFRISRQGSNNSATFDANESAVAYNLISNNFLVVWEGDDNVESINDEFEIFGELVSTERLNDCPEDLTDAELGDFIFPDLYEAINTITSSATVVIVIDTSAMVTPPTTFVAGESITLTAGFNVPSGVTFTAKVETPSCFTVTELTNSEVEYRIELPEIETSPVVENITLTAQPNPFRYETQLYFQLSEPQQVSLDLFDQTGRLVQKILPKQQKVEGKHLVNLRNDGTLIGFYLVVLRTEKIQLVQKVMIAQP